MKASEVRDRYLKFFKERGHKIIPPASLVLENDPTTLFTSSGMQPLVPYLLGEKHPEGKRLTDSQPSIRVQDIEEVGNNRHTTFFEMLGNWSLGEYFKKEQIPWIFEFLTKELGLSKEKIFVTVFEGNESVPKDMESFEIWRSLGVPEERISFYNAKKNWWSRSGAPEQMPVGEIGGPDSEMFFDFGEELGLHEKSEWKSEKCHPNCDCGRFIEVGNSVFIQYKKTEKGLEELPQKNVDFGGGLERITAAVNGTYDVFKIDCFQDIISEIEKKFDIKYGESEEVDRSIRIIADHSRAATALISNGVIPSNKGQGYVLRRLIRRSILRVRKISKTEKISLPAVDLVKFGINTGSKSVAEIVKVLDEEIRKFTKTLDDGLKVASKIETIDGKKAFDLYQTYGFPLELTIEIFSDKGQQIDKDQFQKEFEKHKEKSRTASAGMFKGGLADHSVETTKLHTATHLLHTSLRKVLGDHVSQKGSNITVERLRFDFNHDKKMTEEEIKKVEDMINEQIEKALPVSFEIMSLTEAKEKGALAFFGEKYDQKVKVYTVGDPEGEWFSKEVCGGPHVNNTSELGHVRIIKEEAASAGVRRIYAKFA